MDLQVYVIILIVFLVSFLSYLFISKFLPHGKTFDEMIAEKKRMREEVLGATKNVSSGKQNIGGKKKPKKESRKKESQLKLVKEIASNESDASEQSDVVRFELNSASESIVTKKTATKTQHSPLEGKKSKGKAGLQVNRNELVVAKDFQDEEKDSFFKQVPVDDALDFEKRHFRDVKNTKPISPKKQSLKEAKPVGEKLARKKRSDPSNSAAEINLISEETGITSLVREISRADLTKNQIQVLIDFLLNKQSDTVTHYPSEWSEGKSDLVQKLKKQLQEKEAQLKNEQDALVGTQTKLKELRSELNTERVQFNANIKSYAEQLRNSGMEIKNFQSEIQFLTEKHNTEKQNMSVSFKQLQAQCIQMKESLKTQETLTSVQQLQNENQMIQQESANKSLQIMELNAFVENNRIKDDQLKKVLSDNENKFAEYDVHLRKKEEQCAMVENELRQRVQELSNHDNEMQKLNVEVTRNKDLEKIVQRQAFEMDQLKKQLSDQQLHNRTDESNKIEIKNLQNALDSSKNELEAQCVLVQDYKVKLEDLNKIFAESKQMTNSKSTGDSFLLREKINEMVTNHQIDMTQKDKQLTDYQKQIESLQKAENELIKQIDQQKTKNNDLRIKNWKLVEALQSSQTSTVQSTKNANFVNHLSVEVTEIKDIFAQHFPDIKTSTNNVDGIKWLDNMVESLKAQLVSNKATTSVSCSIPNNNNVTNNNHSSNYRDVETNNLNKSTVNGDSNSFTASSENELVLLQNAQLKTSVEEYKNIIAETESMLKNLEAKVREQDAYWTKIVVVKDNEIESLKTVSEKS